MTTYLGKSCSFGLPRVPFVNCRQFMYLVISLLVLRAGCGIWLYQFLIIAYLFTLKIRPRSPKVIDSGRGQFFRSKRCVSLEDSPQTAHSCSLISLHGSHWPKFFMQNLKTDQTGRMHRLIWISAAHIFCWFCHALAHLKWKLCFLRKTMSPNPPSADKAHFYSLYSVVTLKIRSRSPKSNQFF